MNVTMCLSFKELFTNWSVRLGQTKELPLTDQAVG